MRDCERELGPIFIFFSPLGRTDQASLAAPLPQRYCFQALTRNARGCRMPYNISIE